MEMFDVATCTKIEGSRRLYYRYCTYPDGLHTAYSERHPDGSIYFMFEWPLFMDMGTARCTIPSMKWDQLHGVEEGDLERMEEYVVNNLDLIEELADEAAESLMGTSGIPNA